MRFGGLYWGGIIFGGGGGEGAYGISSQPQRVLILHPFSLF